MARKKTVSPNIEGLADMVRLVPADRKPIAETLAGEIEFIARTLDALKQTVTEHGAVDVYQNGKQEFMRESPALKAYNTTIQRYSLLYKQLAELLPKGPLDPCSGELMTFIQR